MNEMTDERFPGLPRLSLEEKDIYERARNSLDNIRLVDIQWLMGRISFLRARLEEAEAREVELREGLLLVRWALMQPIDDWKGECERKALDRTNKLLSTPSPAPAKMDRMRKALEPFARCADVFDPDLREDGPVANFWHKDDQTNPVTLTYGNFREARAALEDAP